MKGKAQSKWAKLAPYSATNPFKFELIITEETAGGNRSSLLFGKFLLFSLR